MFLLGSLYVFSFTPPSSQKSLLCCTHKLSVCFASLYRIITITRLVQTKDISWAKSDVFIWSSVEPSIGIISGCLPTLRPLLMCILSPWRNWVSSSGKSCSTGRSSRQYPLSPIETISKKRTRKILRKDELDSLQFTQLKDDLEAKPTNTGPDIVANNWPKKDYEHSGNWRPDDDEMCLTTTRIHRSDTDHTAGENRSMHSLDRDGITMTKRFEWDETIRH
jgi:hypothetical protein